MRREAATRARDGSARGDSYPHGFCSAAAERSKRARQHRSGEAGSNSAEYSRTGKRCTGVDSRVRSRRKSITRTRSRRFEDRQPELPIFCNDQTTRWSVHSPRRAEELQETVRARRRVRGRPDQHARHRQENRQRGLLAQRSRRHALERLPLTVDRHPDGDNQRRRESSTGDSSITLN